MEESDQDGGSSEWMDPVVGGCRKMKKRFNEEQVRSLESMFEAETKLDPRKKQQLARELGLHPRQVAIWFQNKRARWKSKQLEREYGSLKADYDDLLSTFESLDKEKQALTKQLQALNERVGEREKKRRKDGDFMDSGCGYKEERKPKDQLSSDGDMNLIGNFIELYGARQTAGDLSTEAEQEFRFQTSWPSDQSCHTSQWWDFWPVNE